MSLIKLLALTALSLATAFAQTEWQEFISPEGNFRVVFPETPNGKLAMSGTYTSLVPLLATNLMDWSTQTTLLIQIGKAG